MIDLSTLKPGDTVVFRNGGRSVVASIENNLPNFPFYISFEGDINMTHSFLQKGSQYNYSALSPFDIIDIIPAPAKQTALDEWIVRNKCCEEVREVGAYPVNNIVLYTLATAINETLNQLREEIKG